MNAIGREKPSSARLRPSQSWSYPQPKIRLFPAPPRRAPRPEAEPIVRRVEKRGRRTGSDAQRQRKAGRRRLLRWELSSRPASMVRHRWVGLFLRVRGRRCERGKNPNLGRKWVSESLVKAAWVGKKSEMPGLARPATQELAWVSV